MLILRALDLRLTTPSWPIGEPTAGEAQIARAMSDPRRAHEFMLARLALRGLAAQALGLDPREVSPAYECPDCGPGEHGSSGFAFRGDSGRSGHTLPLVTSLSRASGWALLALERVDDARPRLLGVDLAAVADFRRSIPDAAFSAAERRRLAAVDDAPAEAARLWARKEALLKANGTGLRVDPSTLETLGNAHVSDLAVAALGLPARLAGAVARVRP